MQYRRLTAHLQTTNADFDRRLAAYLTNHVAMRTALGQAVSDSYAEQYPNAPQFANQLQMQNFQPNVMAPPTQNVNRSPTSYRQSPYPVPQGQNQQFKPNYHNRAASIATPHDASAFNQASTHNSPVDNMKFEDRRMSLPLQSPGAGTPMNAQNFNQTGQTSPTASRSSSSSNLANLKHEAAQQGFQKPAKQQVKPEPNSPHNGMFQNLQPSNFPNPFAPGTFDPSSMNMNSSSFSTALPMESQQLLGGGMFDSNDPMTSMLMGGHSRPSQPFYSYNPNGSSKKSFNAPSSYDGMSQTLAPGVLDNNANFSAPPSSADSVISPWGNSFGMGFDSQFDVFKPSTFSQSGHTSGDVTPTMDQDWANLIDGSTWEESSSQQAAT